MKPPKRLNPIQVAASAAGAVLAAVIASFFGVEGTIIGTAVGSIVATTVSALVWESIERGHVAVRQVVVKEHGPLLHRGSTEPAGAVTSSEAEASAVEVQVDAGLDAQVAAGRPAAGGDAAGRDPGEGVPGERGLGERGLGERGPWEPGPEERLAGTAAAGQAEVQQQSPLDPTRTELATTAAVGAGASHSGAAATGPRRLVASSRSGHPAQVRRTSVAPDARRRGLGRFRGGGFGGLRRRWVVVVGSVVGVFVVALGIVTVVEVIAGRPLSSVMGASTTHSGTSAQHLFTGTAPSTAPKTTTSTTAPPASTTTTSSSTTTTTTPSASSSTTTTTTPSTTTTTSTTTPSAGSSGGSGTSGAGAGTG